MEMESIADWIVEADLAVGLASVSASALWMAARIRSSGSFACSVVREGFFMSAIPTRMGVGIGLGFGVWVWCKG